MQHSPFGGGDTQSREPGGFSLAAGGAAAGAWAMAAAPKVSASATVHDLKSKLFICHSSSWPLAAGRARRAAYSLLSRFMPSTIGCQPDTSEIMITSICRSSGELSLAVDL